MARISVIIPTFNEAKVIDRALAGLSRIGGLELIVVDGGSTDGTQALAQAYGKVVIAQPGRARQMNEGARHAVGEILLFLHADSVLSAEALAGIEEALRDPDVVGGAFRLGIDTDRWALRLLIALANWRTRITGIPYGDQGIFVRCSLFKALGGFPNQPLMEDLEFSRRLKRAGRVVILPETIRTSSRRWDHEGIGTNTFRNQMLVLFYFLGIPVDWLAHWYRPVR